MSLNKRKRLEDKKGTSKIPALIGIILGSIFLIAFLIALIDFFVNGFSFDFNY